MIPPPHEEPPRGRVDAGVGVGRIHFPETRLQPVALDVGKPADGYSPRASKSARRIDGSGSSLARRARVVAATPASAARWIRSVRRSSSSPCRKSGQTGSATFECQQVRGRNSRCGAVISWVVAGSGGTSAVGASRAESQPGFERVFAIVGPVKRPELFDQDRVLTRLARARTARRAAGPHRRTPPARTPRLRARRVARTRGMPSTAGR